MLGQGENRTGRNGIGRTTKEGRDQEQMKDLDRTNSRSKQTFPVHWLSHVHFSHVRERIQGGDNKNRTRREIHHHKNSDNVTHVFLQKTSVTRRGWRVCLWICREITTTTSLCPTSLHPPIASWCRVAPWTPRRPSPLLVRQQKFFSVMMSLNAMIFLTIQLERYIDSIATLREFILKP